MPVFNLMDLKRDELALLVDEETVGVLPVAAIEPHGPHLPLSTDCDIAHGHLQAVQKVGCETNVLLFPTQQIGASDEHNQFIGTLSFDADQLLQSWYEIAARFYAWGGQRLIIMSSHGGNSAVVDQLILALRRDFQMLAVSSAWLRFGQPEGLFDEDERKYGIHGGDIETSMMLHYAPDKVDMDKAEDFENSLSEIEADIDAMGQEFRAQLVTIEAVFVKAVEDYARGQVQPREEKSRTNHFQRLLIHNFEHRFANETDLPEQSEKLSRRMLPGFFNMLQLMLGERRLAQFEKNAKDVVSKLRDKNSGTVDWSEVYRSPDARKLCIQAEIEIARHFTEMEKRLNWMVAILNAHLIPADKRTHSHGWVMNTRNAELMLSALLRDLRAALSNQKARAKMEDKLGQQTVTLLHTIAQRFSLPT